MLSIDVWSDIACPWCYLGKRRLEKALEQVPFRDSVTLAWHAFELDRNAPLIYPAQPSYAARLAAKYRLPLARAEEMLKEMTERGQPEGIAFNWDKLVGVNTFLAHQLQCFARVEAQAGRAPAAAALRLNELVFKWYFTDGRNLSAPETLVQLATDAGFSESSARAALNDPQYFNLVRADESEAQELGITGVPFFVIGRYGVSGAQTSDVLVNVLQKAWDESQEPVEVDGTEGSCEVEGECS